MMTRTIGRIALFMLVAGQCFTGRGEKLGSFEPGEVWADTEGNPINAHAGGVLWVEGDRTQAGRYYWFGQHMVAGEEGNAAQVGVRLKQPAQPVPDADGEFIRQAARAAALRRPRGGAQGMGGV